MEETHQEANRSDGGAPVPPMPSPMALISTLGLIAMFAGLAVVLVFEWTDPIIKEKERLALEKAVYQVVPGIEPEKAMRVSYSVDIGGLVRVDGTADGERRTRGQAPPGHRLVRLDETAAGEADFFAVYDASRELAGIALQGAAQGYQDVVRTLFAYDPGCECIVGLTIMKSTDTPGMGDKNTIEGNESFMANFESLSVALTPDKGSVARTAEAVKHGNKTNPWEVDAISGATITSRAIANGIRETTARLLPIIAQHLDELEAIPEATPAPETGSVTEREVSAEVNN